MQQCHHPTTSTAYHIIKCTNFPVVRETIHLVDEHFKFYVLVDLVGSRYSLVKSYQSFPVVILANWMVGGWVGGGGGGGMPTQIHVVLWKSTT